MKALPIGLSEGCVLTRDIAKDDVVRFDHIDGISEGIAGRLWREQNERWPAATEVPKDSLLQSLVAAEVR
jgi:predicted homoserine dehydrogenase-like protein